MEAAPWVTYVVFSSRMCEASRRTIAWDGAFNPVSSSKHPHGRRKDGQANPMTNLQLVKLDTLCTPIEAEQQTFSGSDMGQPVVEQKEHHRSVVFYGAAIAGRVGIVNAARSSSPSRPRVNA
jgi:hypothetical protein